MRRGPLRGPGASAVRERKAMLRAEALARRRAIPRWELEELSSKVMDNLLGTSEYRGARLVVSYCAKDDEVQTRRIIEAALRGGKRVAVVVTDRETKTLTFSEVSSFEDDLEPGTFGILEPRPGALRPVPPADADLVLVPLVAWDEGGRRLGYGAGYFDRTLVRAGRAAKVGLALEAQRLKSVPQSRHDVRLDVIVTERRVIRAPRRPPGRKDSKAEPRRRPRENG